MEIIENPGIDASKPIDTCSRGTCQGKASWSPVFALRAAPTDESPMSAEMTIGICEACRVEVTLGELLSDSIFDKIVERFTAFGLRAPARALTQLVWKVYDARTRTHAQAILGTLPEGAAAPDIRQEEIAFGGELSLLIAGNRDPEQVSISFVRKSDRQRLVPWLGITPIDARKIGKAFIAMAEWVDQHEDIPLMPSVDPAIDQAELERMRRIVGGLAGMELVQAAQEFFQLAEPDEDREVFDEEAWNRHYDAATRRLRYAIEVMKTFGREHGVAPTPADFDAVTGACRDLLLHRRAKPQFGNMAQDVAQRAAMAWTNKDVELVRALRTALFRTP